MYSQEAQAPQFKFNNLFNEHFPWLIFFQKYIVAQNWQGGKIVRWIVTLINHVIDRAGFTLRGPLVLWKFLQNLLTKYRRRPKKVLF